MTAGTVHNTRPTAQRLAGVLVLPGRSVRVEDLEAADLPARGVYVKADPVVDERTPQQKAADTRAAKAAAAQADPDPEAEAAEGETTEAGDAGEETQP